MEDPEPELSEDEDGNMRAWTDKKRKKKHNLKAGITGDVEKVKRKSQRTRQPEKPSFEPKLASKKKKKEAPAPEMEKYMEGTNFKNFAKSSPDWHKSGLR